jgi:hypothetical protein
MKLFLRMNRFAAILLFFAYSGGVFAQRPGANAVSARPVPGAYDIANDVSLQGTVLSYTEKSKSAPLGTHVLLQTAAGNVDVHLGDARLLHLAKLSIVPGASVRFVGQMGAAGQNPIFLARLVQLGTQIVAVRSDHGLPLAAEGVRVNKALLLSAPADQKGGAR